VGGATLWVRFSPAITRKWRNYGKDLDNMFTIAFFASQDCSNCSGHFLSIVFQSSLGKTGVSFRGGSFYKCQRFSSIYSIRRLDATILREFAWSTRWKGLKRAW